MAGGFRSIMAGVVQAPRGEYFYSFTGLLRANNHLEPAQRLTALQLEALLSAGVALAVRAEQTAPDSVEVSDEWD